MLHSFSRNHHHHHYFKYNRIKEKEDLDGRTQIQIYTSKKYTSNIRSSALMDYFKPIHNRRYTYTRGYL